MTHGWDLGLGVWTQLPWKLPESGLGRTGPGAARRATRGHPFQEATSQSPGAVEAHVMSLGGSHGPGKVPTTCYLTQPSDMGIMIVILPEECPERASVFSESHSCV